MSGIGIKTGDTIEVITGKDRGKRGKVVSADPKSERVVVEGHNLAKRHMKPRPIPGGQQMAPGGIFEQEQPLRRSNIMLVCPSCDKTTRVGKKADDAKVRVCKQCGTEIDK